MLRVLAQRVLDGVGERVPLSVALQKDNQSNGEDLPVPGHVKCGTKHHLVRHCLLAHWAHGAKFAEMAT